MKYFVLLAGFGEMPGWDELTAGGAGGRDGQARRVRRGVRGPAGGGDR